MTDKQQTSVFKQARWIWTEGETKPTFHISNFRKTFDLADAPKAAKLVCCADSKYHLWVNGQYVGFGPARSHPDHPYFDTHEITPYLRKGRNTLAFRVQFYSGGSNIFAAIQGGLIFELTGPGKTVLAASDDSCRAQTSDAYTPVPGTIFAECFDARKEPEGWQDADFKDAKWPSAKVLENPKLAPPEAILPRPIPPLTQTLYLPQTILDTGLCTGHEGDPKDKGNPGRPVISITRCKLEPVPAETLSPALTPQSPWPQKPLTIHPVKKGGAIYFNLDFGRNILANIELSVRGPAGAEIELGYCESLSNNLADHKPGNWAAFNDRIILRKGHTVHRITQPRGVEYMMLRVSNFREDVVIESLKAYEALYPVKEIGEFKSSDPTLDKAYKLGARTVSLCMEDAYTDCPSRERSQWLGDFQPEALFSYYAFGAFDIARKAVLEFGHGNTPEGWIPGVFPITKPFNIPTWGMRFPVVAWEYFVHSGDRETLAEVYEGVKKQIAWFFPFENKKGMLEGLNEWAFIDWTKLDARNNDGALQGWYLEMLEYGARIAREMRDAPTAKIYESKAANLRKILGDAYWSEERKAFLKYTPLLNRRPSAARPDLVGQQENFLFSLLKVGTPEMRKQALATMKGPTGKYLPSLGTYQNFFHIEQQGNFSSEDTIYIGTPFWSYYALLALMEAGEDEAAVEYIRICWGLMIMHNATSCWEMWDRKLSHCHGWSGAPAMILPAYILGVKPRKPGFAEFEVAPRLGGLDWAKGTVPTPRGIIKVSWRLLTGEGRKLEVTIAIPKNTTARFRAPKGYKLSKGQSSRLSAGIHKLTLKGASK